MYPASSPSSSPSPSPPPSPPAWPPDHPGAPRLSKGRQQSRYDLAPPVMRPSAKTVAEQAAAAKALVAIAKCHQEALSAVTGEWGCPGGVLKVPSPTRAE